MVFAALIAGFDTHFLTQNAKLRNGPAYTYCSHREDSMDKYDVIGLVIAIIAVSVVLMH